MSESNGTAPEKEPFTYAATTDDQRNDLERGLLTRRLTELEAEHAAALFGVRQIERSIMSAREDLAALAMPASEEVQAEQAKAEEKPE
jgi:hypothetical protein